jgi:hypothetical protein
MLPKLAFPSAILEPATDKLGDSRYVPSHSSPCRPEESASSSAVMLESISDGKVSIAYQDVYDTFN